MHTHLIRKLFRSGSKLVTTCAENLVLSSEKVSISHFRNTRVATATVKMPVEKPKIVFVLGGPGAGKGTQCQKIVDNFGFVHLSAGDLLREERQREGSEYGDLIENCIRNGKIVPVAVTCSLLEKAMQKVMQSDGKNKFLIDGFPRNQDNLDGWNTAMSEKVQLLFVLFFECSEQICIDRCLNRGQSGSGRSDDNLDSLKKRITTYKNDTIPIVEHYKHLGLVRTIDASQTVDEVFSQVQEAFNQAKANIPGDQ